MSSSYTIHIKTPSGEARIGADTWEGIAGLMPDALKQADPGRSQDNEFEGRVNGLYTAFKKRFTCKARCPSPVETHGFEIDLVRCFLRRLTIDQAIEWLAINKNFKVSRTAIGRYWTRFFTLGFKRDLLKQ